MNKTLKSFLILILVLFFPLLSYSQGYLFIIGGGKRPPEMMKKFIELAEKVKSGKIVVFPMASSVPDEVGPEQAQELRNLGAKKVEFHILTRAQALKEESASILNDAGGVFFSGGVQSRLTDVLRDTPVHKKLLEIYKEGAVIGGTSAGAAVMSKIMITGDEKRKDEEETSFSSIEADNIATVPGFGFIKSAVIDQHFIARKRHNRLISLVAENPQILGIGIDESTAVIVNPNKTFEVFGESNVIVYDASGADTKILPSRKLSVYGMVMHILKPGDQFNLKSKKVMEK
ncbi:MAG: cyanophycinase [Acidobacteriota bacterium]